MTTIYERGCGAEILLIDDNLGDVKLIEIAFRKTQIPMQVQIAGTAEHGLDMLQSKDENEQYRRPDLVLLDLNLPSMHGFTFLERVKNDPSLASIPVLVLSSSSAQRDIAESYDRHANGFLTKPGSLDGYLALASRVSEYWFKLVHIPSAVR